MILKTVTCLGLCPTGPIVAGFATVSLSLMIGARVAEVLQSRVFFIPRLVCFYSLGQICPHSKACIEAAVSEWISKRPHAFHSS